MLFTARFVAISLATTALASPISSSSSRSSIILPRREAKPAGMTAKAIYFITNDEAGNGVGAISINRDGTLREASITNTGGNGAIAVDADGKPAVPDALISQSALAVAGSVRYC